MKLASQISLGIIITVLLMLEINLVSHPASDLQYILAPYCSWQDGILA